jgi:hypothetical protein
MFLVLYIVVGTVGVTPLVNFLRNKRSFVGHILNSCLAKEYKEKMQFIIAELHGIRFL